MTTSLLHPIATEQIIAYSSLQYESARVDFVRQPLHPATVSFIARTDRCRSVVNALAVQNANDLEFLKSAIERKDTDTTSVIARNTQDIGIRQFIFDFVPPSDRIRFGFTAIKRQHVQDRHDDKTFISSALRHGDPVVVETALHWAEREDAIAIMESREVNFEQRRIVIQRFPDEPRVIAQVLNSGREMTLDNYYVEVSTLAERTNNRDALKRLASIDPTNHGIARRLAERYADDAEVTTWLLHKRSALGTLLHATNDAQVVRRIRDSFFATRVHCQITDSSIAVAMIRKFPDDTQLAEVIATRAEGYEGYHVKMMAGQTKSRDVLMTLARSSSAAKFRDVEIAINSSEVADSVVFDLLDNTRWDYLEKRGVPTVRSLETGANLEIVLKGIQSKDSNVAEAARTALRQMSSEQVAAGSASPSGSGLELSL